MSIKKKSNLILGTMVLTAVLYFITAIPAYYNPFFKGSILVGDLNQQYLSFFSYYRHALLGKESILYSFSNGLGGNMIGNWAYYLMSPFNLLLLLVSNKNIPTMVFIIILLKISCASGSMSFFLQEKYRQISSVYLIILSISYALMGFTIINQFNLMWLDGIVLLPLISYAIEKIILKGRSILYIILLSIGLITNYYMGFMLCIFSVVYFAYFFSLNDRTILNKWRTIISYSVSSILSGMLSAFILLPTYANLAEGKLGVEPVHLTWLMQGKPWLLLSKVIIGSPSTELPIIYVSSFALIAFISYFCNKKIAIRERILTICFTMVIVSGLFIGPIYLMWHGFQMPQGYPYRFAFVISFWVISVAAKHLNEKVDLSRNSGALILFGVVLVVGYLLIRRTQFIFLTQFEVIFSGLGFILATIGMLNIKNKRIAVIISTFFLAEMMINTVKTELINPTRNAAPYENYVQELNKTVKSTKYDSQYRLEKSYMRGNDRGEAYQNQTLGASSFSSNFIAVIPQFYQKIGLPAYGYWTTYVNGTKVTDSLLGIRDFISSDLPTNEAVDWYNYGLRADLESKQISIHKQVSQNQLALSPFGFSAKSLSNTSKMSDQSPLENQNKIVSNLSGTTTKVFKKQNQDLQIENGLPGSISYRFDHLENNTTYYLVLDKTFIPNNVSILINGKIVELFPAMFQPVPVGIKPDNGQIKIDINFKKNDFTFETPRLYKFDQNSYLKAFKTLKKETLQVEHFSPTKISGTINIKSRNNYFITTIPYEKNWRIYVDNKAVKSQYALGAFLGARVTPGKHKITFRYINMALIQGSVISIISMLIIFLLAIMQNKMNLKNKK